LAQRYIGFDEAFHVNAMEPTMNQDLVEKIRTDVAALLAKPTEGLDARDLYAAIQAGIEAERDMRKKAHFGGSTLTLNALLAAELSMRTKVFLLPREPIKAT
jgi:hypothetical protein